MKRRTAFVAFGGAAVAAVVLGLSVWTRGAAGVMSASVGLAAGLSVPDLGNPAMIRRGAAHYEQFCAACHGSPAEPSRGAVLVMRPPAPTLQARLDGWLPELLFLTVRDGIRNSAMPAWPARGREDEVWDVVAFLAVLPDMKRQEYIALTGGLVHEATDLRARCALCHGPDGAGDAAFPRLNIQSEAYLYDALRAFRDRRRQSGFMQVAVSGLSDRELADLAKQFMAPSQSEPAGTAPEGIPDLAKRGAPDRKLPPCTACHGTTAPLRADFPRLAGQHRSYLERRLSLFAADKEQGGGPYLDLMLEASHGLTPAEIGELADWYGALGQADE